MAALHISPYSGQWYPADAAGLRALLEQKRHESIGRTGVLLPAAAMAFVVPHASPIYSGTVAAAAYRAIEQQRPERIIVLGFPHHGGLRGAASPDVQRIATPFGESQIEHLFDRVPEAEVCDHSFEIQLPFLQTVAPGARVAPVYVGRLGPEERHEIACRLAEAWRPGTVLIASSDFTHYGREFDFVPFPPDDHVASRLHRLDMDCIDAAGSIESSMFRDTIRETGATVCGAGPIALLLETLRILDGGEVYQSLLDYQTSGDINGDRRHSVSYAALGYYPREAFELAPADREALLDAVAATLRTLRETGRRRPAPARGSSALEVRRGVFVSLHQGEELLGCVGNTSGNEPLAAEATEMALSAALDDPRFDRAEALPAAYEIEISLLTPFRRIRGPESFRIGQDGGLLRVGSSAGLLLPQVAEDRDWTAEAFLQAVCRKANLRPSAWRDPEARLFAFEAQIFGRQVSA